MRKADSLTTIIGHCHVILTEEPNIFRVCFYFKQLIQIYIYHNTICLYNVHSCVVANAVAQWLRRCATNRKVAVSIPDGVIGIIL